MQPIIRRNKNKANLTDAYKAFGPQRSNNAVKLQARVLLLRSQHQAAGQLAALRQNTHRPSTSQCRLLGLQKHSMHHVCSTLLLFCIAADCIALHCNAAVITAACYY